MLSTSSVSRPDPFDHFASAVKRALGQQRGRSLFTVGDPLLFNLFLSRLPEAERQIHTCNECRHFFERYGDLVAVDVAGRTTSVLWTIHLEETCPPLYREAVRALRARVEEQEIQGVFLSSDEVWGRAEVGGWSHLSVPNPHTFSHLLLTAEQVAANKREERKSLLTALAEFGPDLAAKAVQLLESDALARPEKVLGPARWFKGLHDQLQGAKDSNPSQPRRNALLWLNVAEAPEGFCHVRGSMLGTLLDDLAAGKPYKEIARAFAEKMDPTKYQRPTAVKDGNVTQAEVAVAKLGCAASLRRRFARLEEVVEHAVWKPRPRTLPAAGVFAHVRPQPARKWTGDLGMVSGGVVTWSKFLKTVLPRADKVEFYVPHDRLPLAALVTAADPEAPPIIQWDREGLRNPFTWYVYHNGSTGEAWGLTCGTYVEVEAIVPSPAHWDPEQPRENHVQTAFLILRGAKDLRHERSGGLFPEHLRAELRPVRSTIEAYSVGAAIEGKDEASACGLALTANGKWIGLRLVATCDGVSTSYIIDRWD